MWRVARRAGPLRPSAISPSDATLPRAGNRFDVPGIGVVYLATDLEGCFAETLARFRPTTSTMVRDAATADAADQHLMEPGTVPAEWRERRTAVRVTCPDDVLFIDVEDPATHTHLARVLADELQRLHINNLDVAAVRGNDRRLTRLIAQWAYQPEGAVNQGYAGIRYRSRLGDWECWAVFDDVRLEQVEQRPIGENDTALVAIATAFGLRVF